MIVPLRTDSPLRTTPFANLALILLNVAMFMFERTNPAMADRWVLNPRDPHVVHFFTYAFLHANIYHLLGNMLFLYIFGNNVNDKMGNVGYFAFYLAGGVFAGVGYVVSKFSPADAAPVIGASGAVAAVTGAYLALFPRAAITLFVLFATFEVPSMWFIVFFFMQDVVLNFAHDTNVAHAAHVSGSLFGFVVCFALLGAQLLPRDQFDVLALVQRWNKRRTYQKLVRGGYDPFAYVPPVPPAAARANEDPRIPKILELRAGVSEAIAHHNLPHAAMLYLELKGIDPDQVLSRQAQLDVANQLASQQMYEQAAETYEQFFRHYPNFEQIEQVELMAGLIYSRYLQRYGKAKECLLRALARLHHEKQIQLARAELRRVEEMMGAGLPPAKPSGMS